MWREDAMQPPEADNRDDLDNLTRLLLEDVCSDLVRFLHPRDDPAHFAEVRIDREWALGPAGSFADLRVEPKEVRSLDMLQPWRLSLKQ
jgi:hypothetical protein